MVLDGDTVPPWLLAVANNVLRNASRAPLPGPAGEAASGFCAVSADEEELAARMGDERLMNDLLGRLSELRAEEREVIALCDWAGLSYEQAVTTLMVPVGTVRSRLSRSRAHVRARLAAARAVPDDPPVASARGKLAGPNERPEVPLQQLIRSPIGRYR